MAEFVRSGVEFAVVGGYAVGYHARPRATKDLDHLDLLVAGSAENLAALAAALAAFGAPDNVVAAARELGPAEVVYLGIAPVRIDILRSADGIDTDSAIARAVHVDLGELRVPIIGLDDLIANKRAAGRSQGLADAALLERVRERA